MQTTDHWKDRSDISLNMLWFNNNNKSIYKVQSLDHRDYSKIIHACTHAHIHTHMHTHTHTHTQIHTRHVALCIEADGLWTDESITQSICPSSNKWTELGWMSCCGTWCWLWNIYANTKLFVHRTRRRGSLPWRKATTSPLSTSSTPFSRCVRLLCKSQCFLGVILYSVTSFLPFTPEPTVSSLSPPPPPPQTHPPTLQNNPSLHP